jgi:CDP-diglyceride synthetase
LAVRSLWTFVMIAIFFGSMFAGHIYVIIIVTAVQIISFKEVIAISNVPSRARSLRFTKTLNWYFLGTTMYFLYGESVIYYFKHIVLIDRVLLPFATHHRFISFMLYVMGERPTRAVLRRYTDFEQASFSSSPHFKRVTTDSSSPSSHGPIWLST